MTKTFSLAEVLTITSGRLLCKMDGIYQILNHITGDNLFTHQLPRGRQFAMPLLLEEFPFLADAAEKLEAAFPAGCAMPEDAFTAISDFLAGLGHPRIIEVTACSDAWISLNPIDELNAMARKDQKVLVIEGTSKTRTNHGAEIPL